MEQQLYDTSRQSITIVKQVTAIPVFYLAVRRVLELVIVLLILPVVLVIGVLAAGCIAASSKGGVFFIQKRPGKNGKPFSMIKFRTMYSHASTCQLAVANDARITKIGKWLRRYRIDELPQLWNVVRGDMSLIGPRPVPYNFYNIYLEKIPNYYCRHVIRPGITGLAQVLQGYTNTIEGEREKLDLDMKYIQHISFKMDVLIIWNTIKSIFKSQPS